jgi:hypothetical protein
MKRVVIPELLDSDAGTPAEIATELRDLWRINSWFGGGALASSLSSWITQRHQDRRNILAKSIFYREQLYSDFISESAHAMADAIQHNYHDPDKLTPTYALLSRIRLSSSTDVLASAERVTQHIITTYSEPNLTPREIRSRAAKREHPL